MANEKSQDAFAAFAKAVQAQQDERSNHGNGNFTPTDYEDVKWTGLTQNTFRIIRILGNPPESLTPGFKAGNFDAKELYFTEVKDDAGKKMQLKLPVPGDLADKDHIMWKIIRKVMEVKYVDKKRVYKNETDHPDVFNKVAHGGYDPVKDVNQFKYSRGWGGQKVVVMNVIDRENIQWHKEHKHTMLLSRNINTSVGSDGETIEWPAIGVPSYGFVDNLASIIVNYGPWENYDLGIKRTGQKTSPYQIVNASAFVKGGLKDIPDSISKFVSFDPLTDEEKSWERYDLNKLFSPTSYSKLEKRLGGTIKQIDGIFGTTYFDEIHSLAAKEAEEMKARMEQEKAAEDAAKPVDNSDIDDIYGAPAANAAPAAQRVTESAPAATPVRRSAVSAPAATIASSEKLTPEKLSALKGWDFLTDEQKNQVEDVELDDSGKVVNIKYNTPESVVACNECGAPGLMSHTHCIACGVKFE